MVGPSSGDKNPLKDFALKLPEQLGDLLDLEKAVKLSHPHQTQTYLNLKTVFAAAVRHLGKDIDWVFQQGQERIDEY